MQRLRSSLSSLSKSSPAARPRLALTSSSQWQGKPPRPWAGAQRHRPRVPGPEAGPPPGLGSRSPLLPRVAAAASQLGRGRPSPPARRSGRGSRCDHGRGTPGGGEERRGRSAGAQPGDREGGGGEVGRSRPLLRGGLSSKRGAADAARSGCARDPTFSAEAGGSGGGWVSPERGVQPNPTLGTTS